MFGRERFLVSRTTNAAPARTPSQVRRGHKPMRYNGGLWGPCRTQVDVEADVEIPTTGDDWMDILVHPTAMPN